MNKITQIIVEPKTIYTGSTFLLKVKVARIKSERIQTQNSQDILTENGEYLITEGDYE